MNVGRFFLLLSIVGAVGIIIFFLNSRSSKRLSSQDVAVQRKNSSANQPLITGIQRQDKNLSAEDVNTDFDPVFGDDNAPLTFVYWLDFQCPLCRQFELNTFPKLIEKYVETGKMKIVLKDLQFIGQDSQEAAWIAKAVWELYPDLYLEWHKKMYDYQDASNSGFGDYDSVLQMIEKEFTGRIDAARIDKYVSENKLRLQKEQDDDKAEGILYGIVATPGFVIGKERITGVQPLSFFENVIQSELDRLGVN